MIDELNILPCHSIWKPSINYEETLCFGLDREEWVLVSFQIEGNDHLAMVEQILKCLISSTKNRITVLSGGYTKKEFPHISESRSYYTLMMKYYNALSDKDLVEQLKKKIYDTNFSTLITTFDGLLNKSQKDICVENFLLEEFAMDSFDNLYFSLALLKHYHDIKHLKNVIITGFGFKEKRFKDLHWKYCGAENKLPQCALNFDSNYPIHNELGKQTFYLQGVECGERIHGYELFVMDPYALRSKLYDKKNDRNFSGLSAYGSEFGRYLIKLDSALSDQDLLIKIQQSDLYK